MEKKYQIFISSTYEDLKEERKKVQDTILSMYHFPIGMEMFSAADEEQWEIIQETIDSSDYYVLIIGHRYGSIISGGVYDGISYTEKEFRYALSKEIPILAFLIDKNVPIVPDKMEKDTLSKEKLEKFIKEVTIGRTVQWWTSIEDLASKVMNSLTKQINRGKRSGWIRANGLDIEETQKELVEMSKKIRKLEAKKVELEKQIVNRKPKIEVLINNSNVIELSHHEVNTRLIEFEYYPLDIEDASDKVSKEDILEYNKSLPTKEELENYIKDYIEYMSIKEYNEKMDLCIKNNGTMKANDLRVEIIFPEEIIVKTINEVETLQPPMRPKKDVNPFDKSFIEIAGVTNLMKDINHFQFPNKNNKDIFMLSSYLEKNHIEGNRLLVDSFNLLHTSEKNMIDKYCISALQKGEHKIECKIMCEEFLEIETHFLKVIVT